MNRRAGLARRAEALAAELLERAGMRVIARNWRRPEGELDLVAIDTDGTCVFCEVRSRTGEFAGDPLETIDARKRGRVIRTARMYLAEAPADLAGVTAYRFDVVAVTFFDEGEPRVVHLAAAFETTTD